MVTVTALVDMRAAVGDSGNYLPWLGVAVVFKAAVLISS